MHAKKLDYRHKGLFWCIKVLNFVHCTVGYAQLTVVLYKTACIAYVMHNAMQYL